MKTISLKIPERLDAKLTAAATRRGTSKSELVREALQSYLTAADGAESASCLDLTADLVGCVDGGPRDLSYNKKHMKGFGR